MTSHQLIFELTTNNMNNINAVNVNNTIFDYVHNGTDVIGNFEKIVGVWFNGTICIIGSVGNLLSFVALTRTYKSHTSSMVYVLKCLSITDSMFLNVAFVMLTLVNVDLFQPLRNSREAIQKYLWPVLLMLQMMSVWLTVLISWERYIAICKPFKVTTLCSRSRMRRIVLMILMSSVIFNVPRFFEYTEKMDKSKIGESYYYRIAYSGCLYACVLFLLPLSLLFYLNVNLVLVLETNRRNWIEFKKSQQRREQSVTKVPLTIVFIFFFCGTPSLFINIVDSIDPDSYSVACLVLSNALLLFNSSSNFVIYCMLGKKFRGEFFKLLSCRCRSLKTNAVNRLTSEYKSEAR